MTEAARWVRRRVERLLRTQTLQSRIVMLTTFTVAFTVVVVGVAASLITRWSLYDQLDRELIDVAGYSRITISSEFETMGGLNSEALRAANVTLVVVRSDGELVRVPGEQVSLLVGFDELSIARTQTGNSARTGLGSDGKTYRIVSLPMQIMADNTSGDGQTAVNYALVLGRQTEPTQQTLNQLWIVTIVVGGIGVVAAAVFGNLVGRAALSPVRALSAAVKRVSQTDELRPIKAEGSDELADLARSFNAMLRSLDSSRQRQRQLIADAGHELRTPLTSMRTNVELLIADEKSGMLPEGARHEILHDIAAQLGEFTSLVGDLVQLSREEALTPNRDELDLADVVESAVARARRRGPNIVFDVRLSPFTVLGDASTLERAITNLLDNAVKFSPPFGTIRVHLDNDELRISDEGVGIAEEDLPHIFDRFYRSDRARNTPGTGLGLSIVAHTIHAHGGWVTAGRAAGGGSEFVVHLPHADAQHTDPGLTRVE